MKIDFHKKVKKYIAGDGKSVEKFISNCYFYVNIYREVSSPNFGPFSLYSNFCYTSASFQGSASRSPRFAKGDRPKSVEKTSEKYLGESQFRVYFKFSTLPCGMVFCQRVQFQRILFQRVFLWRVFLQRVKKLERLYSAR